MLTKFKIPFKSMIRLGIGIGIGMAIVNIIVTFALNMIFTVFGNTPVLY